MKWLFPLCLLVLAGCSTPGFGARVEPVTGTAANTAQTVGRTQGAANTFGIASTTYNVYVSGIDAKIAEAFATALESATPETLPAIAKAISEANKTSGVNIAFTQAASPSVDNAGLGGEGSTLPTSEPDKPE